MEFGTSQAVLLLHLSHIASLTPSPSPLTHRNYLSKEWFLQRETWGKSSLASQIGDVLGTSAPVNGSEKPLPTPPPSESEKAV